MISEKTAEVDQETVQTTAPTQTVITREVRSSKGADRTIYDASGLEIFFKHFLAGFAQALGMILVYLIFLAIMAMLFVRFALPTIQPYLDLYRQSMGSLQMLQSFTSGGTTEQGTVYGDSTTQPSSTGSSQELQQQLQQRFSPNELQQAQDLLQQMQQKGN